MKAFTLERTSAKPMQSLLKTTLKSAAAPKLAHQHSTQLDLRTTRTGASVVVSSTRARPASAAAAVRDDGLHACRGDYCAPATLRREDATQVLPCG